MILVAAINGFAALINFWLYYMFGSALNLGFGIVSLVITLWCMS